MELKVDLKQLRKDIRKKRRLVSRFQQKQSEQQVLNLLRRNNQFRTAKKIGLYLHAFGEIHTQKLIEYCFQINKSVYLPMICNMNQQLVWVKISAQQYRNKRFTHHPLGMKEPVNSRGKHVSCLDLVLMPLLACDRLGTRIGMGGGFYDKTLASAPHKPLRMGIAHDFQLTDHILPREYWDQPLDALLTPSQLIHFKR